MPPSDKGTFTDRQRRMARYIQTSYERRGLSRQSAQARAWAAVSKGSDGGKKAQ